MTKNGTLISDALPEYIIKGEMIKITDITKKGTIRERDMLCFDKTILKNTVRL